MEGKYLARYRAPSHWGSCRIITNSIASTYPGFSDWYQESDFIPEDITHIVIPDHRWLSKVNLEKLQSLSRINVEWYIFGDLTLKLPDFQAHFDSLKHLSPKIFVASEAQKKLLKSIFPEATKFLEVRPYPIEYFGNFNEESRKVWREKLNITPDQKLIGYIGRISPQKGIIELLEAFSRCESELNARLVLAGPVDPHPFWQYSNQPDEKFLPALKKFLALLGDSVTLLPPMEHQEILQLYSSLDLFVSPSFFHDEDFGLTPSEALSCNVKCLLSDWGGYKRFKGNPNVSFVGLEETEMGFKVHTPSIIEGLRNFKDALIQHGPEMDLNSSERSFILENAQFLNRDKKFNSDLYRKIYLSYVS